MVERWGVDWNARSPQLQVRVGASALRRGPRTVNCCEIAITLLVAFFAGVIAVITTVLIHFAHFGDKNETWTKRLIAIAFAASMIFLVTLFW